MMDTLRNQVVERKVLEMIMSKAEFTDVPLDLARDDVAAVDFAVAPSAGSSDIPEAQHGGEAESLRNPVDRG